MTQQLEALALANESRIRAAAVRRDVRALRVSLADALHSPDAGCLRVYVLLKTVPGLGDMKVRAVMREHYVSEGRYVRDLTERQKDAIGDDSRVHRYLRGRVAA